MVSDKKIDISMLGSIEKLIILILVKNHNISYLKLYKVINELMEGYNETYSKSSLSHTLSKLEKKGLIQKKRFRYGTVIELNKNMEIYMNNNKIFGGGQ
jgi:DNA-binding transcriptional ArsR family regulator